MELIIILGVIITGGIIYLKMKSGSKVIKIPPEQVECIKYWDIRDYFKSPEIQKKLEENKNLRLFAQKEVINVNGKDMYVITMSFFDKKLGTSVPAEGNTFCRMSEKLDDLLIEKFGKKSVLYMEDTVL